MRYLYLTIRVLGFSLGALIMVFGMFGLTVAALAGIEFPVAYAIAMAAAQTQATFLAWMASGLIGVATVAASLFYARD